MVDTCHAGRASRADTAEPALASGAAWGAGTAITEQQPTIAAGPADPAVAADAGGGAFPLPWLTR
ncbi:MAG: hypothetical protein JWP83_3356 [Mycobacterium sp.]|jgi:hypothetical protein|uniref:hypothetical protein n=1 Tax=Mycobacterium sp. TaxID=1785 RepID=UPI0026200AFC|nr:hypothetical protein [Mycobacterium sp.]MCW2662204.1 hypothetical protein [Mycobacterium sp.]